MTDSVTRLRGENLTLGYGKNHCPQPDRRHSGRPFHGDYRPERLRQIDTAAHLSRLMTPVDGSVFLDGEQIQRFASKEVAAHRLLAQNATTPGDITVQELVSRGRYPHQPLFTRWRKEDDDAVNRAMQATGITDLAHKAWIPFRRPASAGDCMVLAQETSICCWTSPPPGWISAIRLTCWNC
jgi:iron complex transport system ATP-binding protein